jgi:glycosyltransferase involved in cell wall biosynthesis
MPLLKKPCGMRMLETAAAIHYTADEERQLAESSLGITKGVVIPLGLEMNDLQELSKAKLFRRRHLELGDSPYVLTLSRLHPKKNIELLVEVFLSLVERHQASDWRLVIAGDGDAEYVDALKRLVRQKGGENHVLFAGWLEGAERASALSEASLLALPSHQENFGLAAAEALACGVPVIVSEHVNLAPQIEKYGAGWVTSLNGERFSNTLSEIFNNDDERKRRGVAGRDFALRNFSWTTLAADLERLYLSIGKRRPVHKASNTFSQHHL